MSTASPPRTRKKVTTLSFRLKKVRGETLTMLTAYDYGTALAVDQEGIDSILVGDSLAMVMLGYENTLPVTMDDMIHHCKAVARGAKFALLIGDMPFMSYQASVEEAVRNAGRFLKEGGMEAVKLEGGRERVEAIRAIVGSGIPVQGHLGLTPQSVHQLGGFRAQAKETAAAIRLIEDAKLLEQAGCFSLVLESIPARLGRLVTERVEIPTIGIGAGPDCDGQVLVTHDILGLLDRSAPRFAKRYVDLSGEMTRAVAAYKEDVEKGRFPLEEHSFEMAEEDWGNLQKWLNGRRAGSED